MSLDDLHALLLQAPLSQLPSVLTDLRGLLAASSSSGADQNLAAEFERSLPALLKRFHEEQGKVLRLPGLEQGSLISAHGLEPSGSQADSGVVYRDEARQKQYVYDHTQDKAAAATSYKPANEDTLRVELDAALQRYLRDHYPELDPQRVNEGAVGAVWRQPLRKVKMVKPPKADKENKVENEIQAAASASEGTEGAEQPADQAAEDVNPASVDDEVDATPAKPVEAAQDDDDDQEGELVEEEEQEGSGPSASYVLRITSGKSNAANFWSGRLISTYTLDVSASTIQASTSIQIHYYENGNVQFNVSSPKVLSLAGESSTHSDPKAMAKAAVSAIRQYESDLSDTIRDTFDTLNEGAFKGLRRQLPVTRSKVDWDKVLNYNLGQDLAGAQAGMGADGS